MGYCRTPRTGFVRYAVLRHVRPVVGRTLTLSRYHAVIEIKTVNDAWVPKQRRRQLVNRSRRMTMLVMRATSLVVNTGYI